MKVACGGGTYVRDLAQSDAKYVKDMRDAKVSKHDKPAGVSTEAQERRDSDAEDERCNRKCVLPRNVATERFKCADPDAQEQEHDERNESCDERGSTHGVGIFGECGNPD